MSDTFASDVGGNTGLESDFDGAQTFTFYAGQEKGDPSDWIYNQSGYMEATVEDLEEYYNSAANLQNTFGSFDNYLAYMTEREQLIQDGLYDPGSYGSTVDTGMVQNVDGTMIDPADIQNLSPNDFISKYGLDKSEVQIVEQETMSGRRSGYNDWLNSEAVQELNAKYGIANELATDDGRKYLWNGSAWVKSFEPENQYDFGNIMKGVTAAGMAAIIGPAVAGVLAPTMGTVAAKAAATALVDSALTLAQGNSLSLTDALTSAAIDAGIGWALDASGVMGQVGEFESTISPELQNSLDILRESNPEKYLEALEILDAAAQQGSGWSQVLSDLANVGVTVGDIVWDANQNDGGDAAQPTVNDGGDYVFDGSDVSVNVPDYSQFPDKNQQGGGGGGGGGGSEMGDTPPWGWVFDTVTGEWNPVYSEEEAIGLPGNPEISVGENKPGEDIYGDDVGEGQATDQQSEQGGGVTLPGTIPGPKGSSGGSNGTSDNTQSPSGGSQGSNGNGELGSGTGSNGNGNGSNGNGNGNNGMGLGMLGGIGGGEKTRDPYLWQPIGGLTKLNPYQKRRHAIYSSLNDGLLAAAMKPSGGIL
jgi:hypothetical protein